MVWAQHKGGGSDPICYTQGKEGEGGLYSGKGVETGAVNWTQGEETTYKTSHLRVAMTTLGLEFSSPGVSFLLETPSLSPYLVREVTSMMCKNSDTTSSTDM